MGVNKVVYSGQTLIDLTSDTVDAASLGRGIKAHNRAGDIVTGTGTIVSGFTYCIQNISIPITRWSENTTYEDYPYRALVIGSQLIRDTMWPDVLFSSDSIALLENEEIGIRYAQTLNGGVYIFASGIPSDALMIDYLILR